MTRIPIERARARRPITWITIVGVVLLPVVIGGLLVAALYNPVERLEQVSAAVVNDDEPVTIDGQYIPLGRQLTAGLVSGSDDEASNLTWTISNTEDAAAGLADGTYSAVVTIPSDFSAAATSTRPGQTPQQATIEVRTAPDALVVDDAITAQVTRTAASLMGDGLSQAYLENVFLGFTTLGDQLGEAADGASTWADGAREAADGTISLADGMRQLASGAGQLSSGAGTWAAGAASAADGLDSWAAGARRTASGVATISSQLTPIADGLAQAPQIPQQVVDAAQGLAANSEQIQATVTDAADRLSALATSCAEEGGSAELCTALEQVAAQANDALPQVTGMIGQSQAIADGVGGLAQLPALGAGLQQMAAGLGEASAGMNALAGGASEAAGGVRQLADGASGIASGASGLASGAAGAADGADALASGVEQLAGGADTLASGLHQASDSLPSYTDDEAQSLAEVVTTPVGADGAGTNLFGASAIPLLAMVALWFGGIASYIALQAVPRSALTSRRPSALLALRGLWPAAAIGAVQGALVAGVVQLAASYDAGTWWGFAALCVLAGVAFAAVNQALVAVFGGAGRWIATLVGVLAVATGIVSTAPQVLAAVAGILPTAPAYNSMVGALTAAGGVGAGVAGMLIWSVLAFGATVLAVVRRRTTSARALLAAPAAA